MLWVAVIVAWDATTHLNLPWPTMSNFVDILDEIDNRFLSNLHNVSISVDALIELDNLIENANDGMSLGSLNA